jgi:hypothetical protein
MLASGPRLTPGHLVVGLLSVPLYFFVAGSYSARPSRHSSSSSSFSSHSFQSSMRLFTLPPIVSGWLPSISQTGAKETSPPEPIAIGHAFIRTPPLEKYRYETPVLTESGEPGIEIREVGYAVFYPTNTDEKGMGHGNGVKWVPPPDHALIEGFEKFLGPRASGWMSE